MLDAWKKSSETPLKINGWNMSNHGGGWFRSFSFLSMGDLEVNQPFIFQGRSCSPKWWCQTVILPCQKSIKNHQLNKSQRGSKRSAESDFFQVLTVKVPWLRDLGSRLLTPPKRAMLDSGEAESFIWLKTGLY